jgi:predicted site-specific integrase-resolvase
MVDVKSRTDQVRLKPKRQKAEQCGVSVRTMDRWIAAGIMPQPLKINGRDYFPDDVMPLPMAKSA